MDMIKELNSINKNLLLLVEEFKDAYVGVHINGELIKEHIEKLVDVRYRLNTLTNLVNQGNIPKTFKPNVSNDSLVSLSKTVNNKYMNKRSGKIYELLYVTNKDSTRSDFKETAVYIDLDTNQVWSRSYSEFIKKNYKILS